MTRLCHTKSIVSVNGQFPGPPIIAREGDRVVVKVVNHVQNNVTIHWYEGLLVFSSLSSSLPLLTLQTAGMEFGSLEVGGQTGLRM